jgi:hypothetical protein
VHDNGSHDNESHDNESHGNGSHGNESHGGHGGGPLVEPGRTGRPTLNTAVRRRRADRAFSMRLAGAIRQQGRALERLKR